jgi:hypothetical protein
MLRLTAAVAMAIVAQTTWPVFAEDELEGLEERIIQYNAPDGLEDPGRFAEAARCGQSQTAV